MSIKQRIKYIFLTLLFLRFLFPLLATFIHKLTEKYSIVINSVDIEIIIKSLSIITLCFFYYNIIIKKKILSKKKSTKITSIIYIFLFFIFTKSLLVILFVNFEILDGVYDYFINFKNILLVVIIAPIEEELLYKGLLFNLILPIKKENNFFRIIITISFISFLFASLHLQFNANYIIHLLFSLITSIIYLKNRSLIQIIIFHMFSNLLVMLNISSFFNTFNNSLSIFLFIISGLILNIFIFIFLKQKDYE